MAYQAKKNWQYDDVVTEQDMNRIERGIEENQESIEIHFAEDASLTNKGHVQLSNEIESTDQTKAPTLKALNDTRLAAINFAETYSESKANELKEFINSTVESSDSMQWKIRMGAL